MKKETFKISAATNVGNIRKHNEDNFFINDFSLTFEQANNGYRFDKAIATPFVAGISDGMGGEKLGEEAAAIISGSLYKFINKYQAPLSNSDVKECIKKINDKVCNDVPKSGATLAMVYAYDKKITALSIGDSRIYIYSNNKLKQISKDHTLAQFQVDAGILTTEEAKNSNLRHGLTQYIGISRDEMIIEPDFYDLSNLKSDDLILICSDGLYDMVEEKEIKKFLRNSANPTSDLINMALKSGGIDNVTVMTITKE